MSASAAVTVTKKEDVNGPSQQLEQVSKIKAVEDTLRLQRAYDKEQRIQEETKRNQRKKDESRVKILLLGARHLASHIVFSMRNHATFTVIDRLDPEYIFANPLVKKEVARRIVTGYQISEMDIERNLMKILETNPFDFVINTISVHDAGFSTTNPIYTAYVNSIYTHGVLNAIAESRKYNPNMKFVHISSDKVYGDVGCPAGLNNDHYWSDFRIDETEPCNPLGVKAISRYNQEILVRQLCKTYDIDYLILRVGNMWGRFTTSTNMFNSMITSGLRTKKIYIYGDPWASRHLCNIEDLADFLKKILAENYDASKWNDVYNVGGDYPTRYYVWGFAQFVMTMLAGNMQKDLDPKANIYVLPYNSVKVHNVGPRWYEDTEDAKIRMWLHTDKVVKNLGYIGERDIRFDQTFKELLLWDMAAFVGYKQDQIVEAREKITYNIQ